LVDIDDVRLYHAVDGVSGSRVSVARVGDEDTTSVPTGSDSNVLPVVVRGTLDLQRGDQVPGCGVDGEDLRPAGTIVMGVENV
jgi:hypothetical protein